MEIMKTGETVEKPETELVQWIRRRRGSQIEKVGVVVGLKNPVLNAPAVGWSLCKRGDKFCPQIGKTIARGRALIGTVSKIPQSISDVVSHMTERTVNYFKN
jgi:hypothetical protein